MPLSSYHTTQITPTKSYPTYQFHAVSASSAPSEDIFRICILESFRWLRNRLVKFEKLPECICTPEPEEYSNFSTDILASFSLNLGCSIESVYLPKDGIWTLTISENDLGANHGTSDERPPVQGRRFTTEISFRKSADHVEAGVRTICSEPLDTEAECEIFRPTFVKKLSENPLVCFRSRYDIDGKPVTVTSRNEADRFCETVSSADFDMPVVIVCEPEKLKKVKKSADTAVLSTPANKSFISSSALFAGGLNSFGADMKKSFTSDFSVHVERKDEKKKKDKPVRGIAVDVPVSKKNVKKPEIKEEYEYTDQETINYVSLADSLRCFGFVVYVSEKCISMINNKLGTDLKSGDVCVMMHGAVSENVHFSDFSADPDALRHRLKYEVRAMLKGAAFTYGEILFGTDAKILETTENKTENMTLEDQVSHLEQLNRMLEEKIKELENNDNGMRRNAEDLRNVTKKLEAESREREKAETALESMKCELENIKASYRSSAFIIDFYRKKSADASRFPTESSEVCDWAEKNFADTIEITTRAKSELRKYAGALDVSMLCDGISYLNGYALYRLGRITEDELALYGEMNGWDVQFCGKISLRVCADDYTVMHNGVKYTLDLHIKSGVKAQQLIRIYFCWDDEMKKVLIGSMPEHLGTAK